MSISHEKRAFDSTRNRIIESVIDRVWQVVAHTDPAESEIAARERIRSCVQAMAGAGEENYVRLVNRSLSEFRRQQARQRTREKLRVISYRERYSPPRK